MSVAAEAVAASREEMASSPVLVSANITDTTVGSIDLSSLVALVLLQIGLRLVSAMAGQLL